MHRFVHRECMICAVCEECTGYGSSCVSSANHDDRIPGQYVLHSNVVVLVRQLAVVVVASTVSRKIYLSLTSHPGQLILATYSR